MLYNGIKQENQCFIEQGSFHVMFDLIKSIVLLSAQVHFVDPIIDIWAGTKTNHWIGIRINLTFSSWIGMSQSSSTISVTPERREIRMDCTQAYLTLSPDVTINAPSVACKAFDNPKGALCTPQSCYHSSTCHECRKIVVNSDDEEELSDLSYNEVNCETDYHLGIQTSNERMDSICTDENHDNFVCNGHCVGFTTCHNCIEVSGNSELLD
ncbi:uncharacterized protein MELLADRAFT_104795 [Melampsora larici-populina 98AG31]|uniref:Uncharacterized protein n=1 Tax=Melampsora larici-populina (strain 98AG31 / pathotype 3-4-7) TaxID=747676 RepID=F4RG75_MELLP|nr:uncharacterized protein MELLADRAFT_104795 [Melampsora larici-populina 98AG31]EGG08716.1 hypothetical protein MELLADRAFT_104795 [Melampsora larici-populina 98AG31]